MNDLAELKGAWGLPDPPSAAAHAAARAALLHQIGTETGGSTQAAPRRPRRRPLGLVWLTGSAAAIAAAAAAALFVATVATPPPATQPRTSGKTSSLSASPSTGQRILLAAATVAQARPATTGTYWHVKSVDTVDNGSANPSETWTTHDGYMYVLSKRDSGVVLVEPGTALSVGGRSLTAEQVQRLPTDPAALKTWIAGSYTDPLQPVRPADMPYTIMEVLVQVLYRVPAPPAVRAAALRALASIPAVTSLGPRDGGQALLLSFPPLPADKFPDGKVPADTGSITLVINPATAALISETNFQGTYRVLTAGWTDTIPKIVQPHSK
jgi:hypothetical protein